MSVYLFQYGFNTNVWHLSPSLSKYTHRLVVFSFLSAHHHVTFLILKSVFTPCLAQLVSFVTTSLVYLVTLLAIRI